MKRLESHSFQFKAQELPQKLSQLSQNSLTGHLLIEFPSLLVKSNKSSWYLGLFQGQVVYSGNQQLCCKEFLRIFKRYLPLLQRADIRQLLLILEQQVILEKAQGQSVLLRQMLHKLQQLISIPKEELRAALRLGILSDFDTYLFNYPGRAKFLASSQLDMQTSLSGFDIKDLLCQAQARQSVWHKLQSTIPSLESVPVINYETVKSANLSNQQQLWLESLTSSGKTLNEITSSLAQDSLEITKLFANLIGKKLIKLKSSTIKTNIEVFVVDDSPIILKQFESLVTSWGYSVRSFQDPTTVLQAMTYSNPAVFFLDINMPGLTGFDLVKEIRRQPQLASVPIIMLTAEQTLTNNWRARWSGCQFFNKPLTPDDVPKFKDDLRILLSDLLLLQQSISVESHLGYQT